VREGKSQSKDDGVLMSASAGRRSPSKNNHDGDTRNRHRSKTKSADSVTASLNAKIPPTSAEFTQCKSGARRDAPMTNTKTRQAADGKRKAR
jgi:hypothetical protein